MKHYAVSSARQNEYPQFLFRVRLMLADPRSGFRSSKDRILAGPWLDDPFLQWTVDMVRILKAGELIEIAPPNTNLTLPEFADEKLISFLCRFGHFPIRQNRRLQTFSRPDETDQAFLSRCRQAGLDERDQQFRKFQDVFVHRFLRLERKMLAAAREEAERRPGSSASQIRAKVRDLFSRVREDFSRCLLREDLDPIDVEDFDWNGAMMVDFQDRLDDLKWELVNHFNGITSECRAMAEEIDPYFVGVSRSDIEIYERAVLWCQAEREEAR